MRKALKVVLVIITIIVVIIICTFRVYFINGRFYIENRWIHKYEGSSKKAHDRNTIIIVDSNCHNTGSVKISGYINDEILFDSDFIIGGEKNTDIKVYKNLGQGEHNLVVKTENGLETHEKIEIGKGQKWVYITYEEDENSKAQIIIKVVDRPAII